MICKRCGTETKEQFCPRCGDLLDMQTPVEVTVPSEPAPVQADTRVYRRPPIRLKMVIWQTLALLFPIAYFFFDAFVVLSDKLFLSSVSGSMNLTRLIERLCNASYAHNAVSEVTEAALGESVVLMESVSLASLISGGSPSDIFWLPLAITTFFVLLCAVSAVLLFFTGGRILRLRSFCNLVLLGGTGAVFAPLVGTLALRLSYCMGHGIESADMMMLRILPSFEHLCIMGILMCALLPSLSSIKGISAYARRQNQFLTFPFGGLEMRSFALKKALGLLALLMVVPLIVCEFFLPISGLGTLNPFVVWSDLSSCYHTVVAARDATMAGNGAAVNFFAVTGTLIRTSTPLATVAVLICCAVLLVVFLRLVTLRTMEGAQKKATKWVLEGAGKGVRNAVLAPYVAILVVQVVGVLFLLFATPVVSHLNFANIEQTLSVLYLAMAYVRAVSGTGTFYSLLAVGGMLLWHTAENAANALVMTEKKGKRARK